MTTASYSGTTVTGGRPVTDDDPEPVDLGESSLDLIRQHLDLLNRSFHALSVNLDRIHANIAEIIGSSADNNDLKEHAD